MALIYTNIQHNFRKENNLTLNEYVLCDMIFFLSKKSDSKVPHWCFMSKETMANEIGLSKQSVITLIKKMCESGFLEKQEITGFVKTTSKWELVYFTDGKESLPIAQKTFDFGKESLPNNNNIIYNNIDKEQKLFSNNLNSLDTEIIKPPKKQKKESDRAILFSASDWINYDTLREHLKQDKEFVKNYKGVDLKHYISKAEMWSENNPNKKRTNRGWLLTLRDWMRSALENNELKLLKYFVEKKENKGFTNH